MGQPDTSLPRDARAGKAAEEGRERDAADHATRAQEAADPGRPCARGTCFSAGRAFDLSLIHI
eukprot:7176104-Alexandrium_andersonii.AAC.1